MLTLRARTARVFMLCAAAAGSSPIQQPQCNPDMAVRVLGGYSLLVLAQ